MWWATPAGTGSRDQARADRQADGPALVAELSDLRRHGAPFDLATLRVPLVLGRGGRSVWHHRQAIDALVELVPDAEVIEIPGSAHGAPLSHPDAFAGFVRRVVERAMGAAALRLSRTALKAAGRGSGTRPTTGPTRRRRRGEARARARR